MSEVEYCILRVVVASKAALVPLHRSVLINGSYNTKSTSTDLPHSHNISPKLGAGRLYEAALRRKQEVPNCSGYSMALIGFDSI